MIRARVLQDTNTYCKRTGGVMRVRAEAFDAAAGWRSVWSSRACVPKNQEKKNVTPGTTNNREESVSGAGLTGGEADDPDVEEVEVGDAGPGLARLLQPAPGAPLAAPPPPHPAPLLPRRRQQRRRRRRW